ncbi:YxlC family protein [Paenibacillus sp. CF384]|uniref:YxlC family protein n=1 Tax=Paenibacillus sp. CF384 TaxID=1884382 RepID=UPI00089CDE41|nr:YxlC family protein [Paenibacillus sp. CF384]SDX44294.1 hypothetical protein SAMN05518855_101419 [Paenibacillus sp. CF384]
MNRDGRRSKQSDNDDHQEEQQFQQLLGVHLDEWDRSMQPDIPSVESITKLVREQKKELGRRHMRELLLFWLVSACVLSGLLLLWVSSIAIFVAVQILAFTAAAVFVMLFIVKGREGRRPKWSDGK